MKRKAKYHRGRQIKSLKTLLLEIRSGRYVFFGLKPMHPTVLQNWRMATIFKILELGNFYLAEPIARDSSDVIIPAEKTPQQALT